MFLLWNEKCMKKEIFLYSFNLSACNKMFNIKFESNYKAIANYDDEKRLKFDPPVYEQRYSAVLRCLQLNRWSGHFKKVGCLEMNSVFLLIFCIVLLTDSGIRLCWNATTSLLKDITTSWANFAGKIQCLIHFFIVDREIVA